MKKLFITITLFIGLVAAAFATPKVVSQTHYKDGGFYIEYDCSGVTVSVSNGTAQEVIADAIKDCFIEFDSSEYISNKDATLLIDQFGYIMLSDWDENKRKSKKVLQK